MDYKDGGLKDFTFPSKLQFYSVRKLKAYIVSHFMNGKSFSCNF